MSKSVSTAGAAAALAGYDYQLNVSVLAALRLLLIAKSATRITLEPANEEDLEADLAPAEPGPVVPSANLASGYKLVVQVKLRGGEPWSVEDFSSLLEHGERRVPAKRHLDDPDTHYLLVTNADVKGVARDLLVSGFEESPDSHSFPASLKQTLSNNPEGRVAIWGGLTERLIELEIGEILSNLLRVPVSRQLECCDQLRLEARRRMRGLHPGVWTRDDLLATIRSYGGYLASAMELEAFVKPSNFEEMVSLLEEKSAIVISGPSGTGKTLAALALCDIARQRDGRIDVVCASPNYDPSATRRLVESGPVLFYVEDPWGQYSLRQGSEAWTEQLPRLLRNARPGHQYVVTSRSDMLSNARADRELKKWSVELDADHYRGGDPLSDDRSIESYRDDLFAIDSLELDDEGTFYARYSRVLQPREFRIDAESHRTGAGDGPFPIDAQLESGLSSSTVREKLPHMREWLISVARSRAAAKYGEMMRRFDLWYGTLFTSLKQLGEACVAAGEPVITALVVDKDTGRCSRGFKEVFDIEDDEAERERCFAHWAPMRSEILVTTALDKAATADTQAADDHNACEEEERVARYMSVEIRQEQPAFRRAVFAAYGGRCAISGCDIPEALEAAHLLGRDWRKGNNQASDGILLRRDLHSLYDSGLLDLADGFTRFSSNVVHHYAELEGVAVAHQIKSITPAADSPWGCCAREP